MFKRVLFMLVISFLYTPGTAQFVLSYHAISALLICAYNALLTAHICADYLLERC